MCYKQDLISKGRSLGMSEKEIEIISNINDYNTICYCIKAWKSGIKGDNLKQILERINNITEKYAKYLIDVSDHAIPFDSMKHILRIRKDKEIEGEIYQMAFKVLGIGKIKKS